jgi:hypothetical protein
VLRDSDAEHSGRTGILIEGGHATTLTRNTVCAPITAIALRDRAAGSALSGNEVDCGGRVALSIGPGAPVLEHLWPAATTGIGFHEKQQLNQYVPAMVCRDQLTLAKAQHDIAAECYALWPTYSGG